MLPSTMYPSALSESSVTPPRDAASSATSLSENPRPCRRRWAATRSAKASAECCQSAFPVKLRNGATATGGVDDKHGQRSAEIAEAANGLPLGRRCVSPDARFPAAVGVRNGSRREFMPRTSIHHPKRPNLLEQWVNLCPIGGRTGTREP